jgi:hypothetical protein
MIALFKNGILFGAQNNFIRGFSRKFARKNKFSL